MPRRLLPLAAALALAAPATASAAERPEWTACSLSGVPKRMSMQKAFTKGIPATVTCHVDANPLVTAAFEDKRTSIAHSSAPPVPQVAAGTTRRFHLKLYPKLRAKTFRHARVRVLVEISASLSGERGPFYGAPAYSRHVTLVR
jgi:hypothetical protein